MAESGAGATSGEYSPLSNAAELFFDDSAGMWRRLPETSETLVALSLSDRVLRKVARVADDRSPPHHESVLSRWLLTHR